MWEYVVIISLMNENIQVNSDRVCLFLVLCSPFVVKLHLQGYSVHSLSYLNKSLIPYSEDEEEYRARFERWRVSLLDAE